MDYALIVGVGKFQHGLDSLAFTEEDAGRACLHVSKRIVCGSGHRTPTSTHRKMEKTPGGCGVANYSGFSGRSDKGIIWKTITMQAHLLPFDQNPPKFPVNFEEWVQKVKNATIAIA